MIKEFKVSKNRKGDYRLGLFGGSVLLRHPCKYQSFKAIEAKLKDRPEGVYRKRFLSLYLITFSVDMTFYQKIE